MLKNKVNLVYFFMFVILVAFFVYRSLYEKKTLQNGIPVTVNITGIHTYRFSHKTPTIDFIYKNKFYSTQIVGKKIDSISIGDTIVLLHNKGTDEFLDKDTDPNITLIAFIVLFAILGIMNFVNYVLKKWKRKV